MSLHHEPTRKTMTRFAFLTAVLATIIMLQADLFAQEKKFEPNYDEAKVPPYTLPDALTMQDGRKVDSAEMWMKERRPELLELFSNEMFGKDVLNNAMGPVWMGTKTAQQAITEAAPEMKRIFAQQ